MGGRNNAAKALTDDLVVTAIRAAAISYGDNPAEVLRAKTGRGQIRRAYSAAASGLIAESGQPQAEVARRVGVDPAALCAARGRAKPNFVAAAAAAADAVAWARLGRPAPADPQPAWPGLPPKGSPRLRLDAPAPEFIPPPAPVRGLARSWPAGAGAKVRPRQRFRSVSGGVEIRRVRGASPDIVRWSTPAIRSGADVAEIAELFDLDPAALRAALVAAGVLDRVAA